jgi:hypothetical protein
VRPRMHDPIRGARGDKGGPRAGEVVEHAAAVLLSPAGLPKRTRSSRLRL